MSHTTYLLLVFIASIGLLLLCIIRLKVNPFLALLVASLVVGMLAGMPLEAIPKQISTGFGQTLGGIGMVIGLGIIFGKILAEARVTGQIAAMLLRAVGRKLSPLAINLTGYLSSIPVFFDAAFVIFMPLLKDLSGRTRIPLVTFVTSMAIGLITTHCLVIPTPGPLAVMGNLKLDAGLFLLASLAVALPASLAGGWLGGRYLGRNTPYTAQPASVQEPVEVNEKLPSGQLSLFLLLLPILMILTGSLMAGFLPADTAGSKAVAFMGDKNVALLTAVVASFLFLRPYISRSFEELVSESTAAAGSILLITGAGGAFGSIMGAAGISDAIMTLLSSLNLSLPVMAFLLAAILRAAQGSATVALVTASAIFSQVIATTEAHPLTTGLAICCGSMCGSLPNDSGFWVVSRFGGLSVSQTLRAWTLTSSISGVTGLLITLIIDRLL
jgi:GntP family gluconate:H+ symporter